MVSTFQLNVCGAACGAGTAVVGDITSVVRSASPKPFVLTLEEMCRSDLSQLTASLPAYHGHFQTTVAKGCPDGSDYGDVVLVRASTFTYLGSWALPNPGNNQPREISCLQASVSGASQPLVACVTHIDNRAVNQSQQIAAVASQAGAYAASAAVVVGGDFNVVPSSSTLDAIYVAAYPKGQGKFVEADSANNSRVGGGATTTYNQWTRCTSNATPCTSTAHPALQKVDYVFLSQGSFSSYSARVVNSPHSDHAGVFTTVALG